MTVFHLFLFSFISLILLITHSYFKRGFRLTFNFFLFAFIAGMRKEAGTFLVPPAVSTVYPTPFIHTGNFPLSFSVLNVTMGWIIVFYLSWFISERVIEKISYFRGKIFPTLLFAGLSIASFSYAIEATAINAGWWKWVFFEKQFSEFLIGGVHSFALSAWFFFGLHFLTPFFLIECSEFRKVNWKCVFFLIPFIRIYVTFFFGPYLHRAIYEYMFLFILIILAFFKPLSFDYPEFKTKPINNYFLGKLIDILPFIVIFGILAVLISVDLIQIKNPYLLLGIFPFLSLILLSLRKLPLWPVFLFMTVALLALNKKGIPAFLPSLIALCFEKVGFFLKTRNIRYV